MLDLTSEFKRKRFWNSRNSFVLGTADYVRAKRLLQKSQTIISENPGTGTLNGPVRYSVAVITKNGQRRIFAKAKKGRGRKTVEWVRELQADLVDEIGRVRKMGIKFSANTHKLLAKDMIFSSTKAASHGQMRYGKDEKFLVNLVTHSWIKRFMANYNIVLRRQTGKLQLLPEAQQKIKRRAAFFLGKVAREFQSEALEDANVENPYETHFLFNMDNGLTPGFRGDESIKSADLTSGGEGMTMTVRISVGKGSLVENPFMIFKNRDTNCPICGVDDNVPGVIYCTGPKGWINRRVMKELVLEKRALPPLPNGKTCSFYGQLRGSQ